MKLNISSLIFFVFLSFNLSAQQEFREFNTNDSTEYVLNNDTTIVVSKTKLYYRTGGGMILFYDFSTADTTRYIRDFDLITDDVWYVIFGDRYWGGPTILYKTIDKGLSWVSDTSIYNATQEPYDTGLIGEESLYQLQSISEDTLILFVSYYQSGIFYSVDSGQSWNLWFANTPANYKGLFKCDNNYFLWGQEGDGFRGSMFSFSSDLLLSPDTSNVWAHWTGTYTYHPDCYNGINPDCVFAPNSMTGYEQFLFFENYVYKSCSDSIVGVRADLALDNLQIYPNPASQGKFKIEWGYGSSIPVNYKIYTANGQLICSNEIQQNDSVNIDLSAYGQEHGIYFLVVKYCDKIISKKILY